MLKMFQLKEHNTTVRTEVLAGVTTFMTMAYILIVNPQILSAAGMDPGALFTATAIASVVGTVAMALLANYPFALAPGMGLNAFFAFSVVLGMGYSWQVALTAVFVEGLIFLLLSVFNVREAMFNAIPLDLKYAVSAGIGLFIALIGFVNAGIVVGDPDTLVTISKEMTQPSIVIAGIGVLLTSILVVKQVKGSILLGILGTWVVGILAELGGWYVPDMENTFSVIPQKIIGTVPSLAPIAFQLDFTKLVELGFWTVVLSFLFVDVFDTLGTLIGVSSKAGFLDKDGKLPKAKRALLADAIGTTVGASLGTSTVTTYVESASGVADGGRTGLTSLTTAALFLLALPFAPLFMAVPAFATAPALIVVGFYMMESVLKVDLDNFAKGIPAFLTILVMPITYSISEGIAFGVISYTVIHLFTGKAKEMHPLMYVLTLLFLLKFIFI
ncbi:NCS2 family permease [Anaerotalea alkaliphila]|uniref:NCS2 family permease n=1 Tax=Anaerotalea alkaliphila TaxID=2662126 RepID=A0A7X5HXM6_9FIRM|nr:NCS2 family permease [Anaerotalea alkaliphila]NDL68381.1 NCS2 family permease [Anaerotalea alkaliphila]